MIVAIVALAMACSQAPPPSEVLLFPRPALSPPVAPQGTGRSATSDVPSAIEDLRGALGLTPAAGFVPGKAPPPGTERLLALDGLLGRVLTGRALDPAARPADTHYSGFRQSAYRFSLNGKIVGRVFEVFSNFYDEADYEVLRGYWVDYGRARVFFGRGVRMRFRASGSHVLFFRPHARAYSWLARPEKDAKADAPEDIPVKKDDIVFEHYGDRGVALTYRRAIRGRTAAEVIMRALEACDAVAAKEFLQDPGTVEPIFIQLAPQASKNLAKSVAGRGARRKEPVKRSEDGVW